MQASRRTFLKFGTSGYAALALGSSLTALTGCSKQVKILPGFQRLREIDAQFLAALAPSILSANSYPGVLGRQAEERLLQAIDRTMLTLQGHALDLLHLAFDLMGSAPLRLAVGAPWGGWKNATPEEAEAFLHDWKTSLLPIKRMGYAGLCRLVANAWYIQPENYPLSGYPGPPKHIPFQNKEHIPFQHQAVTSGME